MSDTVVLIHGLWMTPLSWESWDARFSERGHTVLAPAWPGFDRPIEEIRRDTAPFARLGVKEIADHYEGIIRALDWRHRTQMLSPEQFHYAFCNTLSESASRDVYERYCVPGPGRPLFQAGLANFNPNAVTKVDYHNDDRAPLLILGGGKDHTVPAVVTRSNYKLQQRSTAVTEYKEYADRSHYTVGQEGWEAVADHALEWAVAQTATRAVPR